MTQSYLLERAWLGSGDVHDDVLVAIEDRRFTRVETGVSSPPSDAVRLAGLTIPGLANCHSHAFHRALRGRAQRGRGTFWTWREQMYDVAQRLDPDSYYDLARATYREMAATGITSVGEFHYLHHGPDGTPYDDPNAMGAALTRAARDAGLRISLLDTCYLTSGIGAEPAGVQRRFSDGRASRWQERADLVEGCADVVTGAAIHSVRAVPREEMRHVVEWADRRGAPLHMHVSEQVAENEACLAAYSMTPTEILEEAGALGPRASAVHATHLTPGDIRLLGRSRTHACLCPTTERDLGDGIGPSRELMRAGSSVTLGSDSHAVIDLFEEMRAVEMDERLASRERGHWSAVALHDAATSTGHASIGFTDGGRIEAGGWADLVTVDTLSVRTAGTGAGLETTAFAATAADVVQVIAGGRLVATREDHREIGSELERAITAVWKGDR